MLVNLGSNVHAENGNKCRYGFALSSRYVHTILLCILSIIYLLSIASGQFECIANLVKLGIPIDTPNNQGVLPVHFAANSG